MAHLPDLLGADAFDVLDYWAGNFNHGDLAPQGSISCIPVCLVTASSCSVETWWTIELLQGCCALHHQNITLWNNLLMLVCRAVAALSSHDQQGPRVIWAKAICRPVNLQTVWSVSVFPHKQFMRQAECRAQRGPTHNFHNRPREHHATARVAGTCTNNV